MTRVNLAVGISGLLILVLTSCARPDRVETIKSPDPEVFYTIETFYGHGAIDSDNTKIYLNYKSSYGNDRKKVLTGEYLQNTKIIWTGKNQANLCVSGFTGGYNNVVTLSSGSFSRTIYSHYMEKC